MDWNEVGAIGQVLGSIAVFVTLGYLAAQVRHARDEVRRTFSQSRSEMVRQQFIVLATDTQLNEIYAKANVALAIQPSPFAVELIDRAGLTPEEANRITAMEGAWLQIRTEAIRNLDILSQTDREQFDGRIRTSYAAGTLSGLFFQTMKSGLNADVVRYIEDVLAQPG